MTVSGYFASPEEQNIIKTQIVTKYFKAWTQIMLPRLKRSSDRLAYVDLFAGRGRFEDGTESTPIWVLNNAVSDARLCSRLVTIFNDKDADFARQLTSEIEELPGIERLAHRPQISNVKVGSDVVSLLSRVRTVPTLFFIDPWGYAGLSLDLIGAAIKNWGCDCIFFFNYNRIGPALTNPFVDDRMKDLFGPERTERLRKRIEGQSATLRQSIIMDGLIEALGEVGGKHVLPFRFDSQHSQRPSHYIVFVSKEFRGYHIMKEVMAGLSTDDFEVRNFEYVPLRSPQMALFPALGRDHSISTLKDHLLTACKGQTITVYDAYKANTVGTPYTLKNVQDALKQLEREGRISIDPPAAKRPRTKNGEISLAKDKLVTFAATKGTYYGLNFFDRMD